MTMENSQETEVKTKLYFTAYKTKTEAVVLTITRSKILILSL